MEQKATSSSTVRSPSRPNVPDPSEILSLYQNDELRTALNNNSNSSTAVNYDTRRSQSYVRPSDELEGVLIPPQLPPLAVAVAVPIENTVNEAITHATAVWDDTHEVPPSAPAMNSTSIVEQERQAKARAVGRRHGSQTLPTTLPDSAVSVVDTPEQQVANANAIAQVRAEEDHRYREKGIVRFHANGSIQSERIHEANRLAQQRDREGLEVDSRLHDYEQKVTLAQRESETKNSMEERKNPYKVNPNQSGYHISDYETTEYNGYEYKSDYEYKSVYD